MKKFKTREAAFASQNYDPNAVVITGVPAHHVEALKAAANLFVVHDAENPDFYPDYTKPSQRKFEAVHDMGSPSGVGFAYYDYDGRGTISLVGARLVSETMETVEHIAKICDQDYKVLKVYDRKTK